MTRAARLKLALLAIPAAMLLAIAPATSAQTFRIRHAFNGTDGANPYVGLTQGTDGESLRARPSMGEPTGAATSSRLRPAAS